MPCILCNYRHQVASAEYPAQFVNYNVIFYSDPVILEEIFQSSIIEWIQHDNKFTTTIKVFAECFYFRFHESFLGAVYYYDRSVVGDFFRMQKIKGFYLIILLFQLSSDHGIAIFIEIIDASFSVPGNKINNLLLCLDQFHQSVGEVFFVQKGYGLLSSGTFHHNSAISFYVVMFCDFGVSVGIYKLVLEIGAIILVSIKQILSLYPVSGCFLVKGFNCNGYLDAFQYLLSLVCEGKFLGFGQINPPWMILYYKNHEHQNSGENNGSQCSV